MATLTVNEITRAGIDAIPATAAAGGGDKFLNTGRECFILKNADASGKTVTLVTAATADPDGLAITDKTVTVGAGNSTIIGPFPTGIYNDVDGYMNLTYSAVTSVTVKVFKLPNP